MGHNIFIQLEDPLHQDVLPFNGRIIQCCNFQQNLYSTLGKSNHNKYMTEFGSEKEQHLLMDALSLKCRHERDSVTLYPMMKHYQQHIHCKCAFIQKKIDVASEFFN